MDEIIKAHLGLIEQYAECMAQEALEISKSVTAIFGYCAGRESGVQYLLQQVRTATPAPLNNSIVCNGYQESISQTETIEEIIQEVKEMIIVLKIKGSIRQRSNGLIELRTQALGSIYGRTKAEIEQKLNEKLKEVNKEKKSTKKAAPLLSEFYRDNYLPYKKNQNITDNTISGYESNLKYIVSCGFDKRLTAYKSQEIESFLYQVEETRKRQVLQGFLNNMFNRALALSLIKSNPCEPIEKMKHVQEQGTAFSFMEMREFFTSLFLDKKLTDIEKKYYLFVWLTGTRRGEALGIAKKDVDFENKILTIHGTKTDGSDRDMPLTPLVEKLLKSIDTDSQRYFTLSPYRASNLCQRYFKSHKLHDLRHTFGTIQICVEKVNVKTVSLWLGHRTINTTMNTYTHPEQLDKGTFLRGDLTEEEKIAVYRSKYREILSIIEAFLS